MNQLNNSYFDKLRESIQATPVPWDNYVRAGIVDSNSGELFKEIEPRSLLSRDEAMSKNLEGYATAISSLLIKSTKTDVKRYLALLAAHACGISSNHSRKLAHALSSDEKLWNVLQTGLDNPDEDFDTKVLMANLMARCTVHDVLPYAAANSLLNFLSKSLIANGSEDLALIDLGVQLVVTVLENKDIRPLFWEQHREAVDKLKKLITEPEVSGLQLQYYSLLVFWMLTFDKKIATEIVTDYDVTSVLLWAAKATIKEKVARVSISAILSLMDTAPQTAPISLIAQRALPTIGMISERKWADEELVEDLKTLSDRLTKAFEHMSTFDVYRSELKSKHLHWSPPHKSQQFWKQNIAEFRKNDWQVLHQLLELFDVSVDDAVTQAVACNDISNIISIAPDAIAVMRKGSVKARIMNLLDSSDAEVRYEALKATQTFIGHMFEV